MITYMWLFIHKLYSLNNIMRSSVNAWVDMLEMLEILDTPHDIVDANDAKKLTVSSGSIRFENVWFSYSENTPLFQDFNLHIRPWEHVWLVWVSGSGKSTIVKLLQRFYEIPSGSIKIDEQSISEVTQESLHKNIGLVPQDPILFHRTLKENIAYGKPDATLDEIIAASKIARAHDFIHALEHGYDTLVWERGVKLSGWERQRVAIARAILAETPIMVFDEATSALDSHSEKLIQDSIEDIFDGKTALVIAHRLSTIMKMDRIIVLEKWRIVEEGTHEELLQKWSHYASLWDIQSGEFIDDVGE